MAEPLTQMADEMLAAVWRVYDKLSTGQYTGNVYEIRWDAEANNHVLIVMDADPGDAFDGMDVQLKPMTPSAGETDDAWLELLYDLYAHASPLLDLGRVLAYQSVSRSLNGATIVITDGVSSQSFDVDLCQREDTYPDAFATEFLSRREN